MTHSASTYLETADRIGRRLCRDAVWDGDQCTWLGWSMEPEGGTWQPVRCTAGVEPYGGTSGIGLFLARLWQRTRDPIERTAAEGAARRADEGAAALDGPSAVGLHSGLVGLGYALVEIGVALDDEQWVARGLAHVRRAAALPCDPQALDVVGGSAGAVPVLVDLAHRFREPALLEAAVRHATFLRDQALRSARGCAWNTLPALGEPPLLGYSHGVAGIVVALLEVGVLTGDPSLVEAAREGLRYERSYFRPAEDNWPDLRTFDAPPKPVPSCMTAWCHGAPGIGLARLRTDALLGGDAEVRAELAAAVRATAASLVGGGDFSLCHGIFGNAELLLEVGRRWGRPDVCAPALAAADRAIATIEAARRPWPCGVQGAGETPGLMIGTAGIGHFYLRLADPRVPSVLLPWPAAAK